MSVTGFLRRVFQWMLVERRSEVRYSPPALQGINIDRIAKEMDLENEARRLGEAELPRSEEQRLTGVESKIYRRVEQVRQEVNSWAVERIRALNQGMQRRDLTAWLNQAAQADREFERRASALIAENGQTLAELAETAQRSQLELQVFRKRHRLVRAAHYPESSARFLRFSLLVLLVVGEGALNAVYFAKGISTGLIGGFLYAGSFAFANVLVAYLWGRWMLPNLNHRNWLRKLLGFVSAVAALGTAVAVGLLIAHFRDALSGDLEDAPRIALETFKKAPFALHEIHSWMLSGISVLFAVIALVDGYAMDDPYPGFGRLDARTREAVGDYAKELEALRTALQELKQETLDELDQGMEQSQNALAALHECIERKRATETHCRNALEDATNCLESLLRSFRDANQRYRSTPPPAYFSESLPLSDLAWPDFSVEADVARWEEQRTALAAFVARVEFIRAGIQSSFVRHQDGLQPLETVFEGQSGVEP